MTSRIPARWRIFLLAKGLLLFAMAAAMAAIATAQLSDSLFWLPFSALLLFLAAFLLWAATKAARDVASGLALTEPDVVPLASRRGGLSMKTPTGRFVEFILWNPWEPLRQGARYSVTYGKFSGVIISPPAQMGGVVEHGRSPQSST